MNPDLVTYREHGGYPVGDCCAIANLVGFPWDMQIPEKAKEAEIARIKAVIEEALPIAREIGKSLIVATLNSAQKIAEQALIEAGFTPLFDKWAYRDPNASDNHYGVKLYGLVIIPGLSEQY